MRRLIDEPGMAGRVPLVRALSKLGLASRTEARALIDAGQVTIGGRVARDPRAPVSPERDAIAIGGARARRPAPRLIAFHKPRGVVTTRRDPEGRRTVFDVLGPAGDGLQAVGRLDLASTGLLLLTNDTRLAHALTDPTRRVRRRYVVTVRGGLEPAVATTLEAGLDVKRYRTGPGGTGEHLAAARVQIRKASNRETHLIVELTEGKNRELRRLFGAAGHEVTRVHRIAFGPHELGSLQPGQWREEPVRRT
ncbi:MAG: rRNA pseudouridine synthase [Acidobacteria bacterium]|nr:rRNA pseudouridine synthase [Acidobacteriota bacterium]